MIMIMIVMMMIIIIINIMIMILKVIDDDAYDDETVWGCSKTHV